MFGNLCTIVKIIVFDIIFPTADAIGDVTKKSKNINMNVRQTPQAIGDTGFKARPISDTSGRGLKIRSKKK